MRTTRLYPCATCQKILTCANDQGHSLKNQSNKRDRGKKKYSKYSPAGTESWRLVNTCVKDYLPSSHALLTMHKW